MPSAQAYHQPCPDLDALFAEQRLGRRRNEPPDFCGHLYQEDIQEHEVFELRLLERAFQTLVENLRKMLRSDDFCRNEIGAGTLLGVSYTARIVDRPLGGRCPALDAHLEIVSEQLTTLDQANIDALADEMHNHIEADLEAALDLNIYATERGRLHIEVHEPDLFADVDAPF